MDMVCDCDCVKKLGMALVTYVEKKQNFDDFNEYQMLLLSQTVKLRFFQ